MQYFYCYRALMDFISVQLIHLPEAIGSLQMQASFPPRNCKLPHLFMIKIDYYLLRKGTCMRRKMGNKFLQVL
jgi:hypothetical protein